MIAEMKAEGFYESGVVYVDVTYPTSLRLDK
jgi:hypothetical protein